jgi:hypothetical protein
VNPQPLDNLDITETPRGAARTGGFVAADGRGTYTTPDRAAFNGGHDLRSGATLDATGNGNLDDGIGRRVTGRTEVSVWRYAHG